jgi:hypothetical protein
MNQVFGMKDLLAHAGATVWDLSANENRAGSGQAAPAENDNKVALFQPHRKADMLGTTPSGTSQ